MPPGIRPTVDFARKKIFGSPQNSEALMGLLNAIHDREIETMEVVAGKTKDKQIYDQREKAQRDYEWALSGAREEGRVALITKRSRADSDASRVAWRASSVGRRVISQKARRTHKTTWRLAVAIA